MLSKYMKPRAIRREGQTIAGRFRGGKLAPIMAAAVRESESGTLTQSVTCELDPIAGRMITPITMEVTAVFVPALAINEVKNPSEDYAGVSEVFREKLLSGAPVFGLENENEITKRLGVEPRSIGGVKKVNEAVRFAHIAAVNHLRQKKYVKASLLNNTAMEVTPAIIGKTVLDRLNAVLDPEDRVNGAVILEGRMNVRNIRRETSDTVTGAGTQWESHDGNVTNQPNSANLHAFPNSSDFPYVRLPDSGLSLSDFYQAERMDELTRQMRKMVDDDPQHGEEMVQRFAHGLSIEGGNQPFVLYQKEVVFGQSLQRAMDGANLDKTQTNTSQTIEYVVPIPQTEFGGIVITFASVKPDETLGSQPHPILSDNWGARNYVADELAVDPVPVTVRELNADCDQADENTVVCYNGNNHLLKQYVNYGFNRHLDTSTVENKTAIWQLEIPLSVTPETVTYPSDISHYPFADQTAEICTYNVTSMLRANTPIIFGPTPVEELAEIETANIFEDQ
ncbi:hypothetical protein RUESEDTHA_03603 [Ruegeria sp. THAF57]|uniref:hypothetical protein n=1 Tax=Ruegeria sp. THAF57 TaxID=2744555 RepID=UPI00176CAD27|nr:hypothetical protein [Ruegeria sp. THAF57]CAD0186693.1 hypothetical protein RUESEDTHA_03603 [Ruegeria sp. THAF57]